MPVSCGPCPTRRLRYGHHLLVLPVASLVCRGRLSYILSVRQLVRQNLRFFLVATLAALALRLLFIFRFPATTNDSFVYGDIAKNWLQDGIYGLSGPEAISPTYIRLPGYPAFLAAVFAIFGLEHYRAALFLQMLVDVGTCFLTADMARRLISPRSGKAAFLLAALCPFLASYAAAALTETLEVFFTALALDLVLAGLENARRLEAWFGSGLAVAAAILLRPDGGLLLLAIGLYLLAMLVRAWRKPASVAASPGVVAPRDLVRAGLIIGFVALAPLVPWGLRNLHTLGRFQPLAPRYANEEDEFVPMGFNRWVKTWIADYVSVEEIYWPVPGEAVDAGRLPRRAFDSEVQHQQTLRLIAEYNQQLHVTPELDAGFESLARERIAAAPLRYYFWLPVLRITDMWLRPRTETLPSDTRWWEFDDDPRGSAWAVAMGAIGLIYAGLALVGPLRSPTAAKLGLLFAFVALRSAFLGTLENPEPRYTLECYPLVIFLASALWR